MEFTKSKIEISTFEYNMHLKGVKMTVKPISKFKNEDEERMFWAAHDSTDYVDWENEKNLERIAISLYREYATNKELTAFTAIDGDDFPPE